MIKAEMEHLLEEIIELTLKAESLEGEEKERVQKILDTKRQEVTEIETKYAEYLI